MTTPQQKALNTDQVLKILQPGGVLSQSLKGFEPREQQQQMMRNIIDSYNQSGISLIEAGTGTGKSMAYLIPALLWGSLFQERTLISTNTITLQEQLIHKDIPLLIKALNIDVKAVLVKGMNNYLCLRKLNEAKEGLRMLPLEEAEEIERIDAWKDKSKDGSRSDLSFVPSSAAWEKVGAEKDTCNHRDCPHYQECHFFKARRNASDAQILIANHHMLFADLAYRAEEGNYTGPGVLPAYTRLILDEAHNIEDIATEYFAAKTSQWGIMHILGRLASDKRGKLPLLKDKLHEHFKKHSAKEMASFHTRLSVDLPGMRQEVLHQLGDTFLAYSTFMNAKGIARRNSAGEEQSENKLRILPGHTTDHDWTTHIAPSTKQLIGSLQRYAQGIFAFDKDLKSLKNDPFHEQSKGMRFEITALAERLSQVCKMLENFIGNNPPPSRVRWFDTQMGRGGTNTHLIDAELNVAERLVEFLFSKFSTIILCSATLTTNKDFSFIRKRLGITQALLKKTRITEHMYDSPFNYPKQAMLAIPTDIPHPLDPGFIPAAVENIWQAIQASHGNAFVLFTSYGMLRTCHDLLSKRLVENRYVVLKQGDDNRKSLLNRFKETDRSVLFGTDSFWEGVDVAGEALRCVIIVKLPFKVPSEPITQARAEAIISSGGDPFLDYSLPNAIVKFKQGFGRLIRNRQDRGCIVCLDSRLLQKGYGKQFLNSLPQCQQAFTDSASLAKQMAEFYRKTYHLVAK